MSTSIIFVPGLGLGPESSAPVRAHLTLPSQVITLPGYGEPATSADHLATESLARQLLTRLEAARHQTPADRSGSRRPQARGEPAARRTGGFAGRQPPPKSDSGERHDRGPGEQGAFVDPAEAVVLVGHSASCQIVVQAALDRPELVRAVVLLGPTGDLRASGWPTLAARWMRSAVWESAKLVPVLAPQYRRTRLVSMARAMEVARRYDLARAIGKIQVPVAVVRSRHDRICPAGWVAELTEKCSGEAHTLASGSHMPVLTNGPEVAAVIQQLAERTT